MLTELRIRNFAIIESVALPLASGFNVLSGETGAGKSIIVGALGLLLGERGSPDLVRGGADRAVVEGVFDCSARGDVVAMLDERGIDTDDGLVVLKREVTAAGKGRAWINGTSVTAGALSAVGRRLVNLHGQHEAQTLLDADAQRALLDVFGGAERDVEAVREAHRARGALRDAADALATRRDAALKRADYLRHVASEIEGAKLRVGEEAQLAEEARRLAHVEDLRVHVGQAREALDGRDAGSLSQLAAARRALVAAERLDPALGAQREALESAIVALEEMSRDLLLYETSLERDPARLEQVEQRRDLVHRLARKHGGAVESALAALQEARAELEVIDTADADLAALRERAEAAERALAAAAGALTVRRVEAARRLQRAVEGQFPALGLPSGRFEVALLPQPETAATGAESVEFRVALNVGHDARALARVASGGELSRVMLALQSVLSRLDRVPTLVFDEVDAGIGGAVGLQVGHALRALSTERQVLVITHLAQIAAQAHHQIVVSKGPRAGVTTADIAVVTDEGRVSELARMLGGDPDSPVSLAHARELLSAAEPRAAAPAPARRARARAGPRGRT